MEKLGLKGNEARSFPGRLLFSRKRVEFVDLFADFEFCPRMQLLYSTKIVSQLGKPRNG